MQVILAQPRGFCAGVERAIEVVESALRQYGPAIYVRHEIVHSPRLVENLKAKVSDDEFFCELLALNGHGQRTGRGSGRFGDGSDEPVDSRAESGSRRGNDYRPIFFKSRFLSDLKELCNLCCPGDPM